MRFLALTVACVLVIGAGCTGADSTIAGERCSSGIAAPIDEQTLKRAFAAEGITLHQEESCLAGSVASFSNTDVTVGEEYDSITAAEGHILCKVYAPVSGERSRIERYVWRNDPTPTHVRVLNVSCGVFSERIEHTDAVERAFRRLPGVSELPTTVPGEDAAPA